MGRGNVRNAALVIAAGAFAYLVGDYFDVFGLVANPFDFADAAERVAALQADKTAWDVSNVLAGVGHVITAIGLWMLGRSLAQSSNERRSQVLATAASWAGLATGVWAVNSYFAVVRPIEDVVAAFTDPTPELVVTGLIYVLGVLILFVTLGLVLRRLGHIRWLAWTLLIVGPIAALSVFVIGTSLPTHLMFVLGLALSISPVAKPREGQRELSM